MSARNAKWAVVLFFLTAFISCSQQEDIYNDATNGKEIISTISVKAPEVFKTRNVPDVYETATDNYLGTSGTHSVGNVDLGEHPLTFTVGIYVKKTVGTDEQYILVEKQSKPKVANDEAEFNFRLIEGQKYQIVAYADYNEAPKENLDAIPFSTKLNDELSDAFFVNEEFEAKEHVATVLKRPFGKLRLIAHDFSTFAAGEVNKITSIKVKYKNQAATSASSMLHNNYFNAITQDFFYKEEPKTGGEGAGEGTDEGSGNSEEETAPDYIEVSAAPVIYEQEYDENNKADAPAVFTMYLPANMGTSIENDPYANEDSPKPVPQSWMYPFDVEVTYINQDDESKTIQRSFDFEIPVKRNWLTTIDATYFWTKNSSITVSVDPRFDDEINIETPKIVTVNSVDEMREAIAEIENMTTSPKVGKIILGSDIEIFNQTGFQIGYWDTNNPAETPKKDITVYLDLNGHKISVKEYKNPAVLLKLTQAVFAVYGENNLIIDDTSEAADGTIDNTNTPYSVITCWRYGGNITINEGRFLCKGNVPAIYLCDEKDNIDKYGEDKHSTLTINGGWFENKEGNVWTTEGEHKYPYGEILINIYNGPGKGWFEDAHGFGHVHLNGGSYMDFNPLNGDNICHNIVNNWVNTDTHTVLTETINGRTVYTVIPNETPSYQ